MSEQSEYVHEIGCRTACPYCQEELNIVVEVQNGKLLSDLLLCEHCKQEFVIVDYLRQYILWMCRKAEAVRIKPTLIPVVSPTAEKGVPVFKKRSRLISVLLHIPFLVTIVAGIWFAMSFSGDSGQKTFGFREIGLIFIFWLSLKQSLKLVQRDPAQQSPRKTE